MKLTHKERIRRAIQQEPVDRMPTQINYTRAMGEKLAAHLGVPLVGPSHRMMTDIPLENVDGLLAAFAGLGESE